MSEPTQQSRAIATVFASGGEAFVALQINGSLEGMWREKSIDTAIEVLKPLARYRLIEVVVVGGIAKRAWEHTKDLNAALNEYNAIASAKVVGEVEK